MEEVGWKLDAGFVDDLVVGHDGVVSILAYPWAWDDDDPAFELFHEVEGTTYWVREVPTLRRALDLVERYGGPPEEQRGRAREAADGHEAERSS